MVTVSTLSESLDQTENIQKKSGMSDNQCQVDLNLLSAKPNMDQSGNDNIKKRRSVADIAGMIAYPIHKVLQKSKHKHNRFILKNGALNFSTVHVEKKRLRFIQDMFTTLVDIKWRYMLLLLASAFLCTWIGFALIWWAVCVFQINRFGPACVTDVYDFESALLFSVETQHTIGYGTRAVTTDCRLAIFLVMLQSLIGVTMSCVTTGLVFAKFSKPRRRAETLMFSKKCVIFETNGIQYLAFRVGDIRRCHMIQVTVQAVMFSHDITDEELPFQQHNLPMESDAENLYLLAWPVVVSHKIDRKSPLWNIKEKDLLDAEFEIVIVLEGTNSSTGMCTQICTSYLPSEITWGERFVPLIKGRRESGQYLIDFDKFHETVSLPMTTEITERRSCKDFNDNMKGIQEINFENE